MNTNHPKLALRRQSIRTLPADELSMAHGGAGGDGTGKTTKHTRVPTTGTHRPTVT